MSLLQRFKTVTFLLLGTLALSACGGGSPNVANAPIPFQTQALLQRMGLKADSPIFIRIFKMESQLEIWKQRDDGRYALLKTYPICKWSGKLGPKLKQGDKQAPEGFYNVAAHQMNPKSSYHLSFNLGYPNKLDKAYRRTGNYLMVHGNCLSAGCYAMTDVLIEEIYALAREAFRGGQRAFQVQALPFRMTDENMQKYSGHRWAPFWRDLKTGYDAFAMTNIPPKIDVCEKRYLVNAAFSPKNVKFGSTEICPPYQTFVPEIMETPKGPKIIQALMSSPDEAKRYASQNRHISANIPTNATLPAGYRPLTTPRTTAMRNSMRVSR